MASAGDLTVRVRMEPDDRAVLARWMEIAEQLLAALVERMTPGFHQDHAKRLLGDLREERQRLLGEVTSPPELVGWQPVASSNIAMVRYNGKSRDLDVKFTNMSVYRYAGVPVEVYREFMGATSKGSYLAKHIRFAYAWTMPDAEDVGET